MRARVAIAAAAAVVLLLAVVSQLVLPGLIEGRIEDRLTDGGGGAQASLSGFPAARLLFGDGERVEVSGSGLDLEVTEDTDALADLDGFEEVEIVLTESRAGPFEVGRFELRRDGDEPYELRSSATTSIGELADYSAAELGLFGAPFLRLVLDRRLTERELPIELDVALESDDGRVTVVAGGGTIAGLPTGPLAELLTAAIVSRL